MQTRFVPNRQVKKIRQSLIRSIQQVPHSGKHPRINLGLGELQFPMPIKAQEANNHALRNGFSHYTPNAGLSALREAVASEFSNKNSLAVTGEQVLITVGSTGGLFISFETLLNPGDEVLIPSLHYPIYAMISQKLGAVVKEYALHDNFDIDVDALVKQITLKTKIIVLNSPSNPTGQIISKNILASLAEKTKKFPWVYFVSDEIYSSCSYETEDFCSMALFSERVITINGLSKRASMTGKRLGWMIASPEILEQAIKVQQYAYTCAPVDSQYAGLSVLSGDCDAELDFFHNELVRKRILMDQELQSIPGITYQKPQGAFYYLIDISSFGPSLQVAEKIIQEVNVVTTPGIAFGVAGDRYLRLSFATTDTAIQDGIRKMKGVLPSCKFN